MREINLQTTTWRKVKLGEVLDLKYGFSLPEKKRVSGDIPVYGSSGIVGMNNEGVVGRPGIIVGRKGNVGSIYYSNKPFCPIDTVYYIDSLKIPGDIKFYYYFLKRIPFKKIGSDVGVPGLNRDLAYGLDITIPAEKEYQQRIADILSAFDDKIELNNKISKNLEQTAQAIFKEWFVKFKFRGHEKVKMVDSELGKIPEGWKIGSFKDLLKVKHGFAFSSDKFKTNGIPVIKIKNILENNRINLKEVNFIELNDFKNLENFKLKNGDILIAMTGATSGKIGILIGDYLNYFLNQRVGKFEFFKPENKWFSFIYLTQSNIRNMLLGLSDGSAQGNLSPSQLENLEIVIPESKILQKFDSIINNWFLNIQKNEIENQKLSSLRDLLLPKLMSGEIKV